MARRARRGFNRQMRRKFVWNRFTGSFITGIDGQTNPVGVDLLRDFRETAGASTVGATIMRIRGIIVPTAGGENNPVDGGAYGFLIDSVNEDSVDTRNAPHQRPEEDWLGWLPWSAPLSSVQTDPATWNHSNDWQVDIKAARKLEELGQTLWMFADRPTAGAVNTYFDLSIGMKLP